jgi:hypothetical protein
MHGVTTAIVGFIFAGVLWPHIIKYKVQFYAALIAVVFIILLDGIGQGFADEKGGQRVIYSINALLQISALILLVLSTGMSAKDLGGEVFNTIDVVRRGGEKETIIVPLTGAKPKPRRERAEEIPPARIDLDRDIAAEEAALDEQEGGAAAPPPPPAPKKPESGSIPLE